MAQTEVFDRVILPKLQRMNGLRCPTCRSTDIRGRVYPGELRLNTVIEEHWCVSCRRLISEEESPTAVSTPLRKEFEEAA